MAEQKKRGRPRKAPSAEILNPPRKGNLPNMQEIPEGDNSKFTTFALALMQLPSIDIENVEQIKKRTVEYFKLCADNDIKPGVAALSLALGIDRRRLWEIKTGQNRQLVIPQECKDYIVKIYDSLESLWEMYSQHGKINPVTSIFLGKNNFGYQDKQEYVLTPNQLGADVNPETIRAKYDELPEET